MSNDLLSAIKQKRSASPFIYKLIILTDMKTLACKDMGVDCDFIAKDQSEEGVIEKAMDHAKMIHPGEAQEMMKAMSEEEMAEELKANIKDE